MISIKRPYIENENGKSRLCAEIAIAPEIYEKWKKQIGSRREYAGYGKYFVKEDGGPLAGRLGYSCTGG